MNAQQTDDLDNNAAEVQECITAYIERYQYEFVSLMVGDVLSASIESYLAELEEDENAIDADMDELCSQLRLPCAHYIYYKIAGDVNQQMTITGLQLLKSANTTQNTRQRMVRVWNDMVALNEKFVAWAEESDFEVYYHEFMLNPINQFNL